ncbi:MAG: sensor histidine kinase [Leptospirales bacterium]
MNSSRIATLGIFLAFGIMTGIAVFSFRSIDLFVDRSERVDHTYKVMLSIDRLLSDLQDAETGERGYIITGNPSYLMPYQDALVDVGRQLLLLSSRVSDDPEERKRVVELEGQIRHRLSFLSAGIYLRRHSIPDYSKKFRQLMDYGKSDMDRIRSIMGQMKLDEHQLLLRRDRQLFERKKLVSVAIVIGNVVSFVVIGVSILFLIKELSRRKQAEEKIRRYSSELADLYDNAPCGYHSINSEGLIIRVNETELSWLGYSRDEVEGKKHTVDLMSPESQERYMAAFPFFKETGVVKDFEINLVRKDQTVFPVILNSTAVWDHSGAFLMSRSVMFDITERRRAQEQIMRLNQEMKMRAALLESTNKELEGFSYSVSHDLRSPLRAIDGFTRIILEDYGKLLDQEGHRLLGVVRENSRKMGNLIDDLLAFSRLGRQSLKRDIVEMESLASEAYQEIHSDYPESVSVTIGSLPSVWGDKALLYQVWINLLSNAMKFSSKMEKPQVNVSAVLGEDEVIYSIRDNGVGFDMQYYEKLFGVFQRLHSSEEFPGTGVGLAIVQRVVTRHGGRVWAEGEDGVGAHFFFSLPVRATESFPLISS